MGWFLWSILGFFGTFVILFVAGAIRVAGESDEASAEFLLTLEQLDSEENNLETAERLHGLFAEEDGRKAIFSN